MRGSPPFQPQPDSDSRCADSLRPALSGGLHLLCDDGIHCHTQPGNLYVIVCIYLRTAIVPLRHFMAGRRNARILEIFFLYLPFHFRNQRLCTHQQYGSHSQRSIVRVSGFMDTNRHLLPHHLSGLSLANHTKQKERS